jgi:hypothetical protein
LRSHWEKAEKYLISPINYRIARVGTKRHPWRTVPGCAVHGASTLGFRLEKSVFFYLSPRARARKTTLSAPALASFLTFASQVRKEKTKEVRQFGITMSFITWLAKTVELLLVLHADF